jgi:hypothetical protein
LSKRSFEVQLPAGRQPPGRAVLVVEARAKAVGFWLGTKLATSSLAHERCDDDRTQHELSGLLPPSLLFPQAVSLLSVADLSPNVPHRGRTEGRQRPVACLAESPPDYAGEPGMESMLKQLVRKAGLWLIGLVVKYRMLISILIESTYLEGRFTS